MKLASIFSGLAIAGAAPAAAFATTPAPTTAMAASDTFTRVDLVPRAETICDQLGTLTSALGTSVSIVAWVTSGGVGAYSVCNILQIRGIGGIQTGECRSYGSVVGAATALIFLTVQASTGAEDAPAGDTSKRSTLSLVDHLTAVLEADQVEHQGVTSLPLPDIQTRDDGTPRMLQHAKISGYNHGNYSADYTVADFGSGLGHIFMENHVNQSDPLAKRHDGPGFKISYASKIPTRLSRSNQLLQAQDIGADWGQRADLDGVAEYIGLVEVNHYATFYFRIIPEASGYGEGYESVDLPCGPVGQFL